MTLADSGHLAIDGARLEYRMIGPRPDAAPTIVMLHEGLGSVSTWGEFPAKLAEKTGAGVFVYSRAGYGKSSTITLPRPLDYMQREAAEVLPKLLDIDWIPAAASCSATAMARRSPRNTRAATRITACAGSF